MSKRIIYCFLLSLHLAPVNAEVDEQSDGRSDAKTDVRTIVKNKNSLNAQLAEIEKLYGRTAFLLKTLQSQVELKRHNLTKIREEINVLQTEVSKQNKELSGQIKAAHAMGQQEKLKLLLNQKDPALSSRMVVYYDYLNAARVSKLSQINNAMTQLVKLEQRQQQETALLDKDLEQKKAEQITADSVRDRRSKLLAQFNGDYFENELQINRLKDSENKLKNLIASLQKTSGDESILNERVKDEPDSEAVISTSVKGAEAELSFPSLKGDFSELKGKLPWPVTGQLQSKFGSTNGGAWEGGVLIDAKEGADIRAVSTGAVVYSDWLKDYGLLIIVEHGEGFMTLYAFNQSLYKNVGDKVDAGEVIASVGQSGGRSQPGVYFGIRKKGKPLDPIEWCRR
jgi:septal ring factor EnvC (AmiA/AmiB activator)